MAYCSGGLLGGNNNIPNLHGEESMGIFSRLER